MTAAAALTSFKPYFCNILNLTIKYAVGIVKISTRLRNRYMKRSFVRKTAAVMAIVTLLPMFASCSLFKKKAVLAAAEEFCAGITAGDDNAIIRKTDGLDHDHKKTFKDLLNSQNYTDEENIFNQHMIGTISSEIDKKSVKITKDTATVDITFTIADHNKLRNGDYKDANALGAAVDAAETREIEITAELKEIGDNWYIINFDDEEFGDIFSFYGNMPAIGRGTLIETATKLAESVKNDDSGVAVYLAGSNATPETIETIKNYFDVDGKPAEDDITFRSAVRNAMTYEIDESSLVIEGTKGSVRIVIKRPNFEVLAGKSFASATEIEKAVNECEIINYEYKCELERTGPEWFVTNLDSVEFGGLLSYKRFTISTSSVDGTYKSVMDVTDKFIKYVASEYRVNVPSDCEGKIYFRSTLVLKNGKYEATIDRDAFISDIKSYVEKNIDRIIKNTLGTTSDVSLDYMAKLAGYKDYADMKQKILEKVTTSVEAIDTSSLESAGTFTVSGNDLTFTSATATMPGTIDSVGNIAVEVAVSDADAQKLLESDKITITYMKAA